MNLILMVPLFGVVALVYSMVGFGGGSSYLALLAVSDLPLPQWRPISLLCNVVVVSGSTWLFVRRGHFSWRLFAPFVLTSVPAAYWGGRMQLDESAFRLVLGSCLLVAGLRMLLDRRLTGRDAESVPTRTAWTLGLPLGALLGAISGLVGIGGGIFLAPILYMIGWGRPKQIAATCSAFILVNSLAGLAGIVGQVQTLDLQPTLLWFPAVVFLGGQVGSRMSSGSAKPGLVRGLTAALVLLVGSKILWGWVA